MCSLQGFQVQREDRAELNVAVTVKISCLFSLYSWPTVCMRVWMSDNYIACCWWMSSIIYIFICMIADYRSHCFLVLWVAPICVCSSSVCVCVCMFRRQQWSCPRWGAAGSADSPAGTDGLPHAPACAWPQPAGGRGARAGLAEA